MAEAGTGVGKSFAYLLPAIHFALSNKEKSSDKPVVISTATITLQQQLYEKDIPLVASAIEEKNAREPQKIKAVLMKGRANYICLRRLNETLSEPPVFDFDYEELKQVAIWARSAKTGERSEYSVKISDTLWSSICSEADLCLGNHCQFRYASLDKKNASANCFVLAVRKEANSAHIIVVNHHLLFADLAARYQGAGYENAVILPPFSRLIIDEAHTIENAATSFFSSSFSRPVIFRQLARLYSRRRANRHGLFVKLRAASADNDDILDALSDAIDKIRASADELDDRAMELCALKNGNDNIYRLSPSVDESFLKKSFFPFLKTLRKNILELTNIIRDVTENMDDEKSSDPVVWEIKAITRRLENTAVICENFCKYTKHANDVMWIEKVRSLKNSDKTYCVFTKTPLDMAPVLKDSVFSPNKTVVCVSATLAINNDFSYWASRCGIHLLEKREALSGCFPSPFPYSNAVLLASPNDAPLPDESGYQDFVNNAVSSLSAIAGGSALILFTSYQSLNLTVTAARAELEPLAIRCLKQGDDDRSRLLQSFLSDESSCLFATDSFWEGVDAPGDTLRLVIICRLPFKSPGDPILEARREALEKSGGNPFMDLSLPQAVMKFKQGFGRLMRRSADRGVVAVLDSRLLKKNYGQLFLNSLPETKTNFSDLSNILKDIENFLF
ncbi:MAG: ATP-dependent DNA helicase DinG [Treponema sp.]|nr:ATP-dependent DNA helicase DinG [Treponema sp.]